MGFWRGEGRITQYDYCSCGAINRLIDPNGSTTRWRYDIQGRLTQKIHPDKTVINYTYDPHSGRLATVTDALGQTLEYEWHLDDNLASVTPTNPIHPTAAHHYTWDPHFNRIETLTDSTGTTIWNYHSHDGTTLGAGQIDTIANEPEEHFKYDLNGNLVERTGTNGTTTYHWDAFYHEVSGLHLAPYRAYDAKLGRWISRDPIVEYGGISSPCGLRLKCCRIVLADYRALIEFFHHCGRTFRHEYDLRGNEQFHVGWRAGVGFSEASFYAKATKDMWRWLSMRRFYDAFGRGGSGCTWPN